MHHQKFDLPLLSHRLPHFTFLPSVRDLSVTLDSSLIFSNHISNLTPCSYFHLRRIRAIRKSVSIPVFTFIAQCSRSCLFSKIYHCNSLLIVLLKPDHLLPVLLLDLLFFVLVSLASPLLC